MAREYGKIFTAAWGDPEFRALGRNAQHLYMQLISQPDLSMAGVLTIAPVRWAGQAEISEVEVMDAVATLTDRRFVYVDSDTQELLARSFVRRDGGWRSPTTMKAIASAMGAVLSDGLKSVLAEEVRRLDTSTLSHEISAKTGRSTHEVVTGYIDSFLASVIPHALPLPIPHPDTPTDGVSDGVSDTPTDGSSFVRACPEPEHEPEHEHANEHEHAPENETTTSSEVADAPIRPDVEELLDLLDEEMHRNGAKVRPRIKRNAEAIRLLIDRDQRSTGEIADVIRWCQANEFWRTNILSASKLREKYDQLRMRMNEQPRLASVAPLRSLIREY